MNTMLDWADMKQYQAWVMRNIRDSKPKDGIDGSRIWDYVQTGRIEEMWVLQEDVITQRAKRYNKNDISIR